MLLVLALVFLAGAAFLVGEVATQPARQRREAVGRAASYGRIVLRRGDTRSFHERAILPFAARLADGVLRLSPKTTVESVSLKLISAGLGISPTAFLAVKGGAAAVGVVFGLITGARIAGA